MSRSLTRHRVRVLDSGPVAFRGLTGTARTPKSPNLCWIMLDYPLFDRDGGPCQGIVVEVQDLVSDKPD